MEGAELGLIANMLRAVRPQRTIYVMESAGFTYTCVLWFNCTVRGPFSFDFNFVLWQRFYMGQSSCSTGIVLLVFLFLIHSKLFVINTEDLIIKTYSTNLILKNDSVLL